MTPDTRTRTQDCICLAVRQAARHVTQSYDQFLAPAGLRITQFSILAKLKRKGPMTINALAAATGLKTNPSSARVATRAATTITAANSLLDSRRPLPWPVRAVWWSFTGSHRLVVAR